MTEEIRPLIKQLARRRLALGLTQAEVGKLMGDLPQPVISRLEHGSDVLMSTLERYAAAVGAQLSITPVVLASPTIRVEPSKYGEIRIHNCTWTGPRRVGSEPSNPDPAERRS